MTQAAPAVGAYLDELAACLPRNLVTRELLGETRDHLLEASLAYQQAGVTWAAAERQAVREFGTVADLAPEFRAVAAVGDVQRQVRTQFRLLLLLAGLTGGVFIVGPLVPGQLVDWVLHPLIMKVAAITILGPALVLFALSRVPSTWRPGGWLTWLLKVRTVANWLCVPGLSVCTALLADQAGVQLGAPQAWLAAGAAAGGLGGIFVASRLVVGIGGTDHRRLPHIGWSRFSPLHR